MRHVALLYTCALLWFSCTRKETVDAGVVENGPLRLNEIEPNDRSDQALSIEKSTLVSSQLSVDAARIDEDWYELKSDGPVTLDVTAGELVKGDLVLEVLDTDRNRLVMVNSTSDGQAERIPNLGVSGRVYLRVSGARKGVGGSYTLSVVYRPRETGFEVEPNDRAVESNAVVLGTPVSAYIGHAGDEDWYRFEMSVPSLPDAGTAEGPQDAGEAAIAADAELPGGEDTGLKPAEEKRMALRVELSHLDGIRYEVSVLSEAEAPLFSVKGKDGEGLSLRNVGVRTTDKVVYIVVKSTWVGTGPSARRGYDAERPYTLTVSEEEAGANAEFEPNDEPLKATPLPLDGYKEGFLSPKSDVDYFVLNTPSPVVSKLQLSGVDRLDLTLSVVSLTEGEETTEKVLLKANDGAVKEPEYLNNLACQSTCYIKVEGAFKKIDGKWVRDFENAEVPYRLSVSSQPDDGSEEREPNSTVESAMPIEMGRPVRGTIYPKKDVDYFRVDLSSQAVRTPLRARVTGILKVDLGLYLHRVEADGKLSLVQTADRAKGDAAETIQYSVDPGVYLLEVRDTRNREANFQDAYQLTVEPASP